MRRVGPFDGARCNTYSTGGDTYRHCRKNVSIQLRAGERIGTAGGEGGNALDFGAYDGRMASLSYANVSRHYADPLGLDQSHVVCAIDFFHSDVRDELRSRLGDHSGERVRTVEPICGEVEQDVPGTAQGRWFRPSTVGFSSEDPHVALVHDNVEPSLGAFSVGTSVPGLSPEVFYFTPRSTGRVNLDFDRVMADGRIYCYESLTYARETPINPSRIFLLQLTSDTTLRIESLKSAGCGPSPWAFQADFADFER